MQRPCGDSFARGLGGHVESHTCYTVPNLVEVTTFEGDRIPHVISGAEFQESTLALDFINCCGFPTK